jgi:VanZ family protein
MKTVLKIRITSFWPGILALAVATTLFCLPGREFPRINWLDKIHFDKIAHIGLFSVLVFLWILPPRSRITDKKKTNSMYLWIATAFVAYGIAIEFIQLNFVAHRSFDFFDIVANTVGCAFGGFVASKTSEV